MYRLKRFFLYIYTCKDPFFSLGRYDLNAPTKDIVNRITTMFHHYLESNKTLRLNESFNVKIKVIGLQHMNDMESKGVKRHIFRGNPQ